MIESSSNRMAIGKPVSVFYLLFLATAPCNIRNSFMPLETSVWVVNKKDTLLFYLPIIVAVLTGARQVQEKAGWRQLCSVHTLRNRLIRPMYLPPTIECAKASKY